MATGAAVSSSSVVERTAGDERDLQRAEVVGRDGVRTETPESSPRRTLIAVDFVTRCARVSMRAIGDTLAERGGLDAGSARAASSRCA